MSSLIFATQLERMNTLPDRIDDVEVKIDELLKTVEDIRTSQRNTEYWTKILYEITHPDGKRGDNG